MERLILVHWNKNLGPEPLIQYPPEQKFPEKDLFLKIWAQHELNKKKSLIELQEHDFRYISIIQEYESEMYFLVIVLTGKIKNADTISPDILAIISKNLLELINTNKITRAISEAFNTIKDYNKLESEDLIYFFQDRIRFTILQILRNGVISKTELTNTLRQDYGFSTANIDLLLISFIREKLIIKKAISGSKECYFLINDLSCARVPPKLFPTQETAEEKTIKKFKKEFVKFYSNYNCTQEVETKAIINLLINKDVCALIKILRKKNVSVNECLNLLNNREDLFEELIEKRVIFESKGIVFLLSDIRFIKFKPYYIIQILIKRYEKQEISLNQYLYHLKLLINQLKERSTYLDYAII